MQSDCNGLDGFDVCMKSDVSDFDVDEFIRQLLSSSLIFEFFKIGTPWCYSTCNLFTDAAVAVVGNGSGGIASFGNAIFSSGGAVGDDVSQP